MGRVDRHRLAADGCRLPGSLSVLLARRSRVVTLLREAVTACPLSTRRGEAVTECGVARRLGISSQ
jgi:hypothetical protein